jgi:hypothetical protein
MKARGLPTTADLNPVRTCSILVDGLILVNRKLVNFNASVWIRRVIIDSVHQRPSQVETLRAIIDELDVEF